MSDSDHEALSSTVLQLHASLNRLESTTAASTAESRKQTELLDKILTALSGTQLKRLAKGDGGKGSEGFAEQDGGTNEGREQGGYASAEVKKEKGSITQYDVLRYVSLLVHGLVRPDALT